MKRVCLLIFCLQSIFLYCQIDSSYTISIGDSINNINIYDFSKQYPEIEGGDKLEVTINDTLVVRTASIPDTLCLYFDYPLDEKYRFIHCTYNSAYDTVIVYFDSLMKDTMMLSIYNGYKDNFFKEWYKDGSIKTIDDPKNNINKSWYKNRNLRWDKVPNANNVFGYSYSDCIENKCWYPNEEIMSEYFNINTDTMVYVQYYDNGNPKYKTYNLIPGTLSEGDGYIYPKEYYEPVLIREEYYCYNGQLRYYRKDLLKDNCTKNYKIYHCNGNIQSINEYYDFMQPYGKYTEFYEDGTLKVKGNFQKYDISKKFYLGVDKILEWKYYDNDGKLSKIEIYNENGKLIKTKEKKAYNN